MSIDLTTKYGGLRLDSPLIVGACPLTSQDLLRIAMVSADVGAIVLPSLFEEYVNDCNSQHEGAASSNNLTLNPSFENQENGDPDRGYTDVDSYIDLVRRASTQDSVPIIASLNGGCTARWRGIATKLESAGAAAIEWHLRRQIPGIYSDQKAFEDAIASTADELKRSIKIPLFLKLSRNFAAPSELASRLLSSVNGLVLFGRAPQFDIELDSVRLVARWGLTEPSSFSESLESLIRLHHDCPEIPLAASGGVSSSCDLIKVLLAGADAAMIVSAVYRDGPTVIGTMLQGLMTFMEKHHLKSIADLKTKGAKLFNPEDERLQYIQALSTNPDFSEPKSMESSVESDRWGHPQVRQQ